MGSADCGGGHRFDSDLKADSDSGNAVEYIQVLGNG